MRSPLVPIPTDKIAAMLGRPIHLRWAETGCVWILVEIANDVMSLRTPKTGKTLKASVEDACYTRYWEARQHRLPSPRHENRTTTKETEMPEIAAGREYPLCPEGVDIFRLKEVEAKDMTSFDGTGTTPRLIWKFVSRQRDPKSGEFFEVSIFTPTNYSGHPKSKLTWLLRWIDKRVTKDWIKSNKLNTDEYVDRDFEAMVQHTVSEDGSKTYATFAYLKPLVDKVSAEAVVTGPDPFVMEGEVIPCESCGTEITELERQRCLAKWNGNHYFCTPHAKAFLAQEADLFAAA